MTEKPPREACGDFAVCVFAYSNRSRGRSGAGPRIPSQTAIGNRRPRRISSLHSLRQNTVDCPSQREQISEGGDESGEKSEERREERAGMREKRVQRKQKETGDE